MHEVFVSRQGEGPYVGEKQVFFRFSRCNMTCNYCDTDNSIGQTESVHSILAQLEKVYWQESKIQSMSITGGEPLLYPEVIPDISDWAHKLELNVFLETNGVLPENLEKVIALIDVVSMDLKLPSVSATPAYWKEHALFLKTILEAGKKYYLKMVLSDEVETSDFDQAIDLVASQNPNSTLFLQPVTPLNGVPGISQEKCVELKERALSKLWDVRIQPQWHKYWGVR